MGRIIWTPENILKKIRARARGDDKDLGDFVRYLYQNPDKVSAHYTIMHRLLSQEIAALDRWEIVLIAWMLSGEDQWTRRLRERAWEPVWEETHNLILYLKAILEDLEMLQPAEEKPATAKPKRRRTRKKEVQAA